ncbi:MAG: preprotein translocase subunit SecA [Clostridia bacterium]
MKLLEKVFGTYSSKELKRIEPTIEKINALSGIYEKLENDEIRKKTEEFKERYKGGETLESLLPEAFALVREASSRVLNMRPYDVQLVGGVVLFQGRIAEMKTGEGKTLVATLPAYLNAITGKGVHVITVNDYLAKYQSILMGKLYKFLGLSVGLVIHGMTPDQKRQAYAADITYGTNNEFGFDYLRDNMSMSEEEMVQRPLNYAVVDEIDSILVDEARTPLIISGMAEKSTDMYVRADKFVKGLTAKILVETDDKNFDEELENFDYVVDLKAKTVTLTDRGTKKAESYFGVVDLSDVDNLTTSHHINQALRAYGVMHNEQDYIVQNGEVLIVDEFTGRLMYGRKYSDGLHQAIEAKEKVEIAHETKTLATITFQNYFRMYEKLSGMTGTAKTEEQEFKDIYALDVIEIPTNKPVIREDKNDVIYKTQTEKYKAIVDSIKESYEKGQPVLVGTITIEISELISKMLKAEKIQHKVLNAKYHEQEASIVAQAGRYKAVTIATNMAGRGTDIMLGGNSEFMARDEMQKLGYTPEMIDLATSPINHTDVEIVSAREKFLELENKHKDVVKEEKEKVLAAGGLKIIGSERHESRRIDNQLRGRAGRQGDPGETKFYISFQDDLMKLFAGERMMGIANSLGVPDDTPIEQKMLTSSVEKAQAKVEGRNYSIRKSVLEYDDVMNKQREIIYKQRRTLLEAENIKGMVLKMAKEQVSMFVPEYVENAESIDDINFASLNNQMNNIFGLEKVISRDDVEELSTEYVSAFLYNVVENLYEHKLKNAEENDFLELYRRVEKYIMLRTVDQQWMDHIDNMSGLKDGIGLRAYGQNNPVIEFKKESFSMFEEMVDSIQKEALKAIFQVAVSANADAPKVDAPVITAYSSADNGNADGKKTKVKQAPVTVEKKVGRNEPCPCGSGKKYKQCCGKVK